MNNFALTGVAGFIAPRHLQAIKDTGNRLVAAMDPHDSVGILDRYFPDASYFSEYERFDRHLEKIRREGKSDPVHFISICSPNHLHDAHIRLALRVGASAICEKPLVLNPWNLDMLEELESEYNSFVYNVLQLRLHPSIMKIKENVKNESDLKRRKIKLVYITSRGNWYRYSWKGDVQRSGGIATNIGIHFFDMLLWIFGDVLHSSVCINQNDKIAGELALKNADVEWYLSLDHNDLPENVLAENQRTCRLIEIDDEKIEFSDGFTGLHTRVYENILSGNGCGIKDARPSIELVYKIRNNENTNLNDNYRKHMLGIK